MLLRCHARALPVPVMGGVGKLRPITAMVADLHNRLQRCLTCFRASVSDAAHHEIAHPDQARSPRKSGAREKRATSRQPAFIVLQEFATSP
jgi:hypothetical protein